MLPAEKSLTSVSVNEPEEPPTPLGLFTVTETAVELVKLLEVSVATAVSKWEALLAVLVFQLVWYGALVNGDPRLAPSSLNCTLAIPLLSEAVAVTLNMLDTVWFGPGDSMETVGGVRSAGCEPVGSRTNTSNSGAV